MRASKTEWSQTSSNYFNQSDASTVKSQLDTITKELEDERKKVTTVISKQQQELEEVKSKREESENHQKKMIARMNELQSELEQTIKRIEMI